MAIPPTKKEKTPPKTVRSIRQYSARIKEKESNRESQTSTLAVSPVYSSKKGPTGAPINSGSVSTKFVHKMPLFQNAYHSGNQISTPSRFLDHFCRFQRWLLAHTRSTQKTCLSRVYIQKSRLSISRDAIRFECGTPRIHKSNITFSESTSKCRYLVPSISGRSVNNRSNTGRVYQNGSESTLNNTEHGFNHQREEIKTHSSSKLRMVRHTMESSSIHSPGSRKQIPMSTRRSCINYYLSKLHKESSDASTGTLQLDRSERPQYSPSHDNNKNNSKVLQRSTPRHSYSNSTELEITPLCLGEGKGISSTPRVTSARSDNPVRRNSSRLGIHNKSDTLQREVRPLNEVLNQYQGIDSHLDGTSESLTEEHHNISPLRQQRCHSGSTKRRINVIPSLLSSRADMEEGNNPQLDITDMPHKRSIQCHSRPTIQERAIVHGMVSGRKGLSENPSIKPAVRSGPVCNQTQQQTSNVCVTMSRPTGSSTELTSEPLGQVESPLPISTDSLNFEGFMPSDPILLYYRNTYNTRYTHETLVYGSTAAEGTINSSGSETSADSGEEISDPTQHYQTSRVEVIRSAYRSKFHSDQQTLGLLATPIRQSSLNDYEIKWNKFCSYLRSHRITPSQLSLNNVLEFFSHLFYEKNLRPNTVAHYRSALTVPLQLKFNINLHDPAVSHLIRSMAIKRPANPASTPAWSLNKLLELLDTWSNNIPLEKLLQKTVFLLLLATGWRISELHACVRLSEFCYISVDQTLNIRPHPSFLAKNECPQKRWTHKVIQPLRLSDGTISDLCPVAALAEYLRRTSRITVGSLLIHPSTQKPLTKYQLSSYISKLIHKADPHKDAKPHDIRKYAASCSLAKSMNISGMVNALQWKSPHTFYKFYLSPTVPLTVQATLPRVENLNPEENTSPDITSVTPRLPGQGHNSKSQQ